MAVTRVVPFYTCCLLRLLFFTVAQVVQLIHTINLAWPERTTRLLSALTFVLFAVDYVRPQCGGTIWRPVTSLYLQWLLQPLAVFLVGGYLGVAMALTQGPSSLRSMLAPIARVVNMSTDPTDLPHILNRSVEAVLVFSKASLASAVATSFRAFICVDSPKPGQQFVKVSNGTGVYIDTD